MKINSIELQGFASYKDYNKALIPMGITGILGNIEGIEGGSNGCLAGDSIINTNRATLGKKYTIKHMYESYNKIGANVGGKHWPTKNIKTFVRSFKNDNRIGLHEIENVVYSGKKEVWALELANGLYLKATPDHKIMTTVGWVALRDLKISISEVMCDSLKAKKSDFYLEKSRDKEVYTIPYHKYATKFTKDINRKRGYSVYSRLPVHILIYEAYMNNLTYECYLDILRNDKEKAKTLKFINPKKYDIHHKDFNHYNNDITNLECLEKTSHQLIHSERNKYNFNQGVPVYSRVTSIGCVGVEDTYDIICKDPYRNFVANGIIVHNSGKTKIVMGMLFALYGDGTFDKIEEIWNDCLLPSEDAFAKVDFELNGNNYVVERGRKAKGSYLDVFENGKRIGESVKNAQEYIIELLGMDEKLFKASIFFAQKEIAAFIETDPKGRKDYVDLILDLEQWRVAGRNCNKRYKEVEEEIKKLDEDILYIDGIIKSSYDVITQITKELAQYDNLVTRKKELQVEIDNYKNIDNIRTTITQLSKFIQIALDNRKKSEESKDRLEADFISAENAYTSALKQKEFLMLEDTSTLQETIESLEQSITTFETALDGELIVRLQGSLNLIATTQAELSVAKEGMSTLAQGICDKCGQIITEQHILKHKIERENQIKEYSIKLEGFLATKKEVENLITAGRASVINYKKELKEKKDVLDKYKGITQILQTATTNYQSKRNGYHSRLAELNQQTKSYNDSILGYNTQLAQEQAKLPKDSTVNLVTLNASLKNIEETITELDTKRGRLQQIQEEKTLNENNLEISKNKLKEAKKNVYSLEVLADAFKQIPTALLKESIVEIEKYANEIIKTILPRYRVRLYEDEAKKNRPLMVAFEVDGRYRNYKLLSGGQQAICAISLRMGFNKIISKKARVSLNFLVLDEIFGSLDEPNRIEILNMLGGLQKYFSQILVITHTEEASIFPNTIQVRMNDIGISYI
jgi:DNA repair exonuclease SbcCD ATPase subunit